LFCLKPHSAVNGHHEPYTGHQNSSPHMTEDEKLLLEQLKNTSLSPSQNPRNFTPNGGAPTRTQATFNVPIVPSPLLSRRFADEDDVGSASIENVHLSVGDSKKQIKLSSDSGLGSSELGDDHQHWKNGKISFFFEGGEN